MFSTQIIISRIYWLTKTLVYIELCPLNKGTYIHVLFWSTVQFVTRIFETSAPPSGHTTSCYRPKTERIFFFLLFHDHSTVNCHALNHRS